MVADQPAREAGQDRREGREHGPYVTFQMAEVAVSRQMFADILTLIARLTGTARASMSCSGMSHASDGRERRCVSMRARQQFAALMRADPTASAPQVRHRCRPV